MVGRFLLIAGITAVSLLGMTPVHALATDGVCPTVLKNLGKCDGPVESRVTEGTVELAGEQTHGGVAGAGGASARSRPLGAITGARISCVAGIGALEPCIPSAVAGTPDVTIRDIESFRPIPAWQVGEPDGWTIAGLDTNFYAITDPHVVAGVLLGRPAEVRFTPRSFRWEYGDGTGATLGSKGAPWRVLGVREFDPTPTSHVYEEVGNYTITLAVTFTAEYRFDGSGWRPVVGSLTVPANELYLRAGTAKTVLVDEHCGVNPSGPGC